MLKKQRIIIIAGPNGAGKTTFAREYLLNEAHCPDFINVDLIAAGLSPFDPDRAALQAGRIMLSEIERRVRKRESFAFETTLSGHIYARKIPESRTAGYRRLTAGLRNFQDVYMNLVDTWEWYDNSGSTPQLISAGRNR